MLFDYDPRKSSSNLRKHGIDFEDAQTLWDDPLLLEVPARASDEPRWIAVGRIGDRIWSAIFTRRDDRIRIISVRRARSQEIEHYESA